MAEQNWGEQVYASLLLNDAYLPGALVLAHSLRDAGTTRKLAILVTLDSVTADAIVQLKTVYDYVLPVPRIRNDNPINLHLMNRPDLHSVFTKINLWKQTQFSRIVYVDADVVAYRAPDELFDVPYPFAAVSDIGWPDSFNTGVMVLSPNNGDYHAMIAMAGRGISFDGGDQGLLNIYFKNNFHRLSFTYNVTPSAHYQYLPAYRHFQASINIVHFIGSDKPWHLGRSASYGSSAYDEMVGRWWAVYDRHYREKEISQLTSGGGHNQAWEAQKNASLANSKSDESDSAGNNLSSGWYQVPRAIFPWEGHQPPPSRSFFGDEPSSQSRAGASRTNPTTPSAEMPASRPPAPKSSASRSPVSASPVPKSPGSKTSDTKSDEETATSWTSYSRTNAWDEVPEITKYVEDIEQTRRSRSRSLKDEKRANANPDEEDEDEEDVDEEEDEEVDEEEEVRKSRSFKVTDFPTGVERPSLAVTPAPVPGDNHEVTNEALPAAEGVPPQPQWFPDKDPTAQLEMLARQQSAMLLRRLEGKKDDLPGSEMPTRPLLGGSRPTGFQTRIAQSAPDVLSPQPVKGTATVATTSLESRMSTDDVD